MYLSTEPVKSSPNSFRRTRTSCFSQTSSATSHSSSARIRASPLQTCGLTILLSLVVVDREQNVQEYRRSVLCRKECLELAGVFRRVELGRATYPSDRPGH